MENYHLFTIRAIPATESEPTKVSIVSERHGHEIIISLTERDAAAKYLKENGYNLVGKAEGQPNAENLRSMYLISDTFTPFYVPATYVSVWDGGTTIRSKCLYSPLIYNVTEIDTVEVEGLEVLENEFLELKDGTVIVRPDFTIDFDVD